jgi:hypothetical protein
LQSDNASADAYAIIKIYSSDGNQLLAIASGSLKDGINLIFTPETIGEEAWLCVEVEGQDEIVTCELEYIRILITSLVSLDNTVLAVSREDATVNVPMTLTLLQNSEIPIVF